MKTIPKVNIADARRLTPMEMNNLQFKRDDSHSPLPPKKDK